MAELKRILGFTECIFLGVGSILAPGIYTLIRKCTLIGKAVDLLDNLIWLSFFIAAVSALFTAFSTAELSAAWGRSITWNRQPKDTTVF